MRETAVFLRQDASLVGILSEPPSRCAAGDIPVVILLNAGIVHRVGLNRLHVKIARELAAAGFPAMRFDFSGIGDSPLREDDVPFHASSVREVQQVMDYLCAREWRRFVLLGLCSGANVAFRTAARDPRVAAIIGINGTYLDEEQWRSIAARVRQRIHGRYYRKHATDVGKWWRFIRGKSDMKKIVAFVAGRCAVLCRRRTVGAPGSHTANPWDLLSRRRVDSLLVYAEGSGALDAYSLAVKSSIRSAEPGRVTVSVIENCDHAFTLLWSQRALMDLIRTWMLSGDRSWKPADPHSSASGGV